MKTVQNVKNSLKFKAAPRKSVLSVKVGTRKFALPVEARLISQGDYVFLSFGASSEIYKVENGKLGALSGDQDATPAHVALNSAVKAPRKGRAKKTHEVPAELASALSKHVPKGFKLGFDASGQPRLVKLRTRKK